ncbi:MAG: spore germination protein [Clostridiales bacterium]|nr:spore germination protein [Clostridiales bacterium]
MTKLEDNIKAVKDILISEDILVFEFKSLEGKKFAIIYADEIANKFLLGELVIKPLREVKKDAPLEEVKLLLASPELKDGSKTEDAVSAISNGDGVLFVDGESDFFIIGLKAPPTRAVAEPPTQVAVKGPREGFIEDIKTNVALVRKRLKSKDLVIKNLTSGERSDTMIALVYIEGVCPKGLAERIQREIEENTIDFIPDSSYVSQFIEKRPRSIFKSCGTAEKPDIFCAKVSEGRVGILVDGSPIALTVPYMLVEDFQSVEDYYTCSYRSTTLRVLRLLAVGVGILLPALYISAQLFKIQIIPFKLLLKISSSVAGLALSPSVEMFLTLFVLEVLTEASIRMPKYVGLALSVVGALVLGDTAVKAGIISTPAIIIIAFSAICLYAVPALVETSATFRWIFLIVGGSIGPFGAVLLVAYLICYLVSEQSYGVPLVAPFAPLIMSDLFDAMVKANMFTLKNRPTVLKSKEKVRLKGNENK